MLSTKTKEVTLSVRGEQYNILLLFREASKQVWILILLQYLLDSVITCWSGLEGRELPHVRPLKNLRVLKRGSVAKHRAEIQNGGHIEQDTSAGSIAEF